MSTHSQGGGKRVTILELQEMKKRGERIAVLTAYDWLYARLVDTAGSEIILVGDSLAHVVLGLDSTLSLTLDEMIYHARAVRRGVERGLVVVDLPFLTYQISAEEAVRNSGRVLQESGAEAVKLEGGGPRVAATVERIVEAGIPVMGHLGFTPQSVIALGGNRVQGRGNEARARLVADAKRLQDAGAFSLVLELIPGDVAAEVTAAVHIPTIGIGAGIHCDGQVLVLHDMLGLNRDFQPKFLRRFAEMGELTETALRDYVEAVKSGEYPAPEHTFS
jgi:3-methyl-2-oxobutanoate hydroxymethyltransferase